MAERLSLAAVSQAYAAGVAPRSLLTGCLARIAEDRSFNAWITVLSEAQLEAYLEALDTRPRGPLWGVPFAVKDNIDVAGLPTTAGCEAFAYTPSASAPVVQALIDAGAIPLGKTHLDQFATGLVGTRAFSGPCLNSVDPAYLSGGSSSGSAVAVGRGHVAFSLGTDTAGSGRVPAAFNGLYGLKPSRGLLSTKGVVPACESLDCVSIFAPDLETLSAVAEVASTYDSADDTQQPWPLGLRPVPGPGRGRLAVPLREQVALDGAYSLALWDEALAQAEAAGFTLVPFDAEPLLAAGRLLYEGPWVAERYAVVAPILESAPETLFPVTRSIVEPAEAFKATEAFAAFAKLKTLGHALAGAIADTEAMLLPTVPGLYTQEAAAADPVGLNSRLGIWTNFMNLLGYCGLAVPTGHTEAGLPFGITLARPEGEDAALLTLAAQWTGAAARPWAGRDPGLTVAVCGAHLSGLPLNGQLQSLGGIFLEATESAPLYRFCHLPGGPPERPGMVREREGAAIAVELWHLPYAGVGQLLEKIPSPLGLGTVPLSDGREVKGFICEAFGAEGGQDISAFGGWRAYLAEQKAAS